MRGVILLAVAVLAVGLRGEAAHAQTRDEAVGDFVRWNPTGIPWGTVTKGGAGHAEVDPNALLPHRACRADGSWARRGAVLGALVGGVATYLVLHSGGSTSLCDRSANQDAMGRRECVALTVVSGAAGAGLGAWIGSRFPRR